MNELPDTDCGLAVSEPEVLCLTRIGANKAGFIFNHPLLPKYEWHWRVEPEITYFYDMPNTQLLAASFYPKRRGYIKEAMYVD